MRTPEIAEVIVREMVKAVSVPVTVKFRKGWDDNTVTAIEFAKRMEAAGASAIAVHGRTRMQYDSGKADWDIIAQVKQAVQVPVIGNGDVCDVDSYIRIKEETVAKIDAISIQTGRSRNELIGKFLENFWRMFLTLQKLIRELWTKDKNNQL